MLQFWRSDVYFILAHGYHDARYHRPGIEQLAAAELLDAVAWLNRNKLIDARLNSIVTARLCDLTYRVNGGDSGVDWSINVDSKNDSLDITVLAQILQLDNDNLVPKHLLMPLLMQYRHELQEIDDEC